LTLAGEAGFACLSFLTRGNFFTLVIFSLLCYERDVPHFLGETVKGVQPAATSFLFLEWASAQLLLAMWSAATKTLMRTLKR